MTDTPRGRVQTVLGPIDPGQLGWTLPHEHTAISLWHIPNRWDYWELRRDESISDVNPKIDYASPKFPSTFRKPCFACFSIQLITRRSL